MAKKEKKEQSEGEKIYDRLFAFFQWVAWGLPVIFLLTRHYPAIFWHFVICFVMSLVGCAGKDVRSMQTTFFHAIFMLMKINNKTAAAVLSVPVRFIFAPSLAAMALTTTTFRPFYMGYIQGKNKYKS